MKAFARIIAYSTLLSISTAAFAQPVLQAQQASAPLLVASVPEVQPTAVLPANTEIMLSLNDTLSTKGRRWNEGDTFGMTVTHDVRLGRYVVIPRGSRGVGRITFKTGKGMFGKSGKMEFDIEYVDVAGQRIPVTGNQRQEGEGNTVATVGAVVAVGLVAGLFVTGHSGTIQSGTEFVARTRQDVPVAFAEVMNPMRTVSAAASPSGEALIVGVPARGAKPLVGTQPSTPAPEGMGNSRVRCVTCR